MLRADVPSMEGSAMPFGPQVLYFYEVEFAPLSPHFVLFKGTRLSYVDFEFAATRNS